ncbi:MAG: MBL fold metallo-hydrolase [Candidatus Omnitrophota bacterium]
MNKTCILLPFLFIAAINNFAAEPGGVETISSYLNVYHGAVNGARIQTPDGVAVIYGDPLKTIAEADYVLFTHNRRDLVWAGRSLAAKGAKVVVPKAEANMFSYPAAFWNEFPQKRFHDYAQQSTNISTQPISVSQTASEGGDLVLKGQAFRVLDAPGFTRGAVAYLSEIDGRKIAFTGDLIYGDGRIFDLYSFQDAIPEAKIGGYHGYAARIAQLIGSLRKIAAQNPEILIPARGPVIGDPPAAIARLIDKLQKAYANYLSICALRWYFGDDHILTCAVRVLVPSAKIDWMPMAETLNERPPSWIVPIDNSRLMIAADRSAFLVDCGGQSQIDKVKHMLKEGAIKSLDGVYITHYHDDHTDHINALVQEFGCPVYCCAELKDILENPSAYRLPCLTPNAIPNIKVMKEGETLSWKEFIFTFSFYPGQTLYHGGLLAEKNNGEKIFFIGDSFTPSGIDDYCLLNRNLLHPGTGYFYCLDVLKKMKPDYLLINEHVVPTFRYSQNQLDRMIRTLQERVEILRDLFPWDDPNFGIDEQWARFYPYGSTVKKGETLRLELRIMNHSPDPQSFMIRLNLPPDWSAEPQTAVIDIPSRQEDKAAFTIPLPSSAQPGTHVVTADVLFGEWELREWREAIISVEP